MSEPTRFPGWLNTLALFAALVLLQLPLWINPGYFSHDELQWAARATTASVGELPFVPFTAFDRFQFRPLTFNLWLLLSQALFDSPRLFHLVFVLSGSLNALLLAHVLRRAGCRRRVAAGGAMAFALSPFAAWVHGWVGCLGDLLWVGCALGIVAVLQRPEPRPRTDSFQPVLLPPSATSAKASATAALMAATLTVLALLAKEAALAIPALLALGTSLLRMPRAWVAATLASAVVAAAYLVLRLDTLTSPGDATSYALDATAPPLRWLEYMVFPWALGVQEIHVLRLADAWKWAMLAVAPLALGACLWRASRHLWLGWLAGGMLALAPVLALPVSANQYGYGFAALCCGIAALAWERLERSGRHFLAALALLSLLHGYQIQMRILETGRLQATFSPSLAAQVRAQPQGTIRLWPEQAAQFPVYARLTHHIPSWRGIPLGERAGMADSAIEATHRITPQGHVMPVTP